MRKLENEAKSVFETLLNEKKYVVNYNEPKICHFYPSIHKPSHGSSELRQKIGPDRYSRFDVYWIKTDKQSINIDNLVFI